MVAGIHTSVHSWCDFCVLNFTFLEGMWVKATIKQNPPCLCL